MTRISPGLSWVGFLRSVFSIFLVTDNRRTFWLLWAPAVMATATFLLVSEAPFAQDVLAVTMALPFWLIFAAFVQLCRGEAPNLNGK